jgi:ribonuclease HI
MTIHLYTDGGIRPLPTLPQGWGLGGTGYVAADATTQKILFEGARHHPSQTTNQRMELSAAIEGLEMAMVLAPKRQIIIHSDSAYMVNCIGQAWWYNWMVKQNGAWLNSSKQPVENSDLWRALLALCRLSYGKVAATHGPKCWTRLRHTEDAKAIRQNCESGLDVSFVKVKGHSGIPLNERADLLATRGKNGETLGYPVLGG